MKYLWIGLGILSLAFAGLGVVLPILPTTPLVILAAFFFSKGSPRLHNWLLRHRLFGPLIRDWRDHGAIPKRAKLLAITMMGAVFIWSLYLQLPTRLLLIQAICLGGAATFILTRPSGPKRD